jgi:hypothetical protein
MHERNAISASGTTLPTSIEASGTAGVRLSAKFASLRNDRRFLAAFQGENAPIMFAELLAKEIRLLGEHTRNVVLEVLVGSVNMPLCLFSEFVSVQSGFFPFSVDLLRHLVKLLINRIEASIDGIEAVVKLLVHRGKASVNRIESFKNRHNVSLGGR